MIQLAAIAGVLIISFSAILVRQAGVSPDTSAFFRGFYALPVLLLVWLRFGERRWPARQQGLALLAGLFLGVDLIVWHRAIQWIGAGLATVLGNTQVLFVGLAAWALYGERPRRAVFLGLPLAFVGMTLVSGLGRPDAYGEDPALGTLLGLVTGICYSIFLLLFRRATHAGETPFGPFFLSTLALTAVTGAYGAAGGGLDPSWSWPAHGWLALLALGSQVAGWLLIAYALPRLPAVETSVLLLLQPMATVLWGFLIFDERLSALQWLGVALVLFGVGLPTATAARGRVRRRRAAVVPPA